MDEKNRHAKHNFHQLVECMQNDLVTALNYLRHHSTDIPNAMKMEIMLTTAYDKVRATRIMMEEE